MKGAIGALVAVVAAGATAAGIAALAKRKKAEEEEPAAATAGAGATAAEPGAVAAEPAQAPEAGGVGDDLTTIKGIGAINQERLAAAGVTTFAQIAAWSDEDVESVGDRISVSPGRIRREDWIGQARAAAEG